MSFALYDSLVEKWRDFLNQQTGACASLMLGEDVDDSYYDLVDDFCEEHNYSEKTKNFAFHGRWWVTFADEYYQRLEDKGVKIIHNNPTEHDWDYGKKFKFENFGWTELSVKGSINTMKRNDFEEQVKGCIHCGGSGKIMRAVRGCGHSDGAVIFVDCEFCEGNSLFKSEKEGKNIW